MSTSETRKLPWQGYVPPWHAVFREYDPELMDAFRTWQRIAMTPKDISPKTRELIVVAIDSVVKWPSPFIDAHIHAALDHGATTQELLEAIGQSVHFGSGQAVNHGIIALMKCIRERRAAGVRTPPNRSEPNGDTDPGDVDLDNYDAKDYKLFRDWQEAAAREDELDDKSRALIAVSVDSLIAWPSPYVNPHVHAAFDAGATIQEVLEAVATANHFGHAFNHGLTVMGEVIGERTAAGTPPPRRKSAPKN